MNEVRSTQTVATQVLRPASSTGAENAKTKDTAGQDKAPVTINAKQVEAVDEAKEKAASRSADVVETAVSKVNDYVQSIQRDLQFSVDEELDQTVVKVVDGSSGELIRQIPEEVFLELARKLNENGELQLMNALG